MHNIDKDYIFENAMIMMQNAYSVQQFLAFDYFLDLAKVVYFPMQNHMVAKPTKELLQKLNLDKDEVIEIAEKNTLKNRQFVIKSMSDIISELDCNISIRENVPDFLYVGTARDSMEYAASIILDRGLISSFADSIGKDLLILPSSIHEILFLPRSASDDIFALEQLVTEINHDVVNLREVLSNRVYCFDRDTQEFQYAGDH